MTKSKKIVLSTTVIKYKGRKYIPLDDHKGQIAGMEGMLQANYDHIGKMIGGLVILLYPGQDEFEIKRQMQELGERGQMEPEEFREVFDAAESPDRFAMEAFLYRLLVMKGEMEVNSIIVS